MQKLQLAFGPKSHFLLQNFTAHSLLSSVTSGHLSIFSLGRI